MDKIVCIDESFINGQKNLTWGKEYRIVNSLGSMVMPSILGPKDVNTIRRFITVVDDLGLWFDTTTDRFVSKAAFRELQLKKLDIL
jgi:hypothetical protein